MKTILISGNDTHIGKTWVLRALATLLGRTKSSVQIVKPIECGNEDKGDVSFAIGETPMANVSGHTLYSFKEPVAPLNAAKMEGVRFSMKDICEKINALPDCDWRVIEGAGGLAVPIDSDGKDWADFAKLASVDYVIVVVENRLGFINQSRLVSAYLADRGLNAGIWLNECNPIDSLVKEINLEASKQLTLPLWAVQNYGESQPRLVFADWLKKLI